MISPQRLSSSTDYPDPDRTELRRKSEAESQLVDRALEALAQLLQSYDYAEELDRSAWDFAVEISVLRKLGLSNSDLRWLLCKGFLAQGRELPPQGDDSRTFRRTHKLTFSRRTCFVLQGAGVDFIRTAIARFSLRSRESSLAARQSALRAFVETDETEINLHTIRAEPKLLPVWDRDRQELRVGNQVVKHFKVPAPNQELVLSVFQEEGWPIRIDDPLPPQVNQTQKRRLHDTINSLNRQKISLIRFAGDGKGTGVLWEFIPSTNEPLGGNRYLA